MGNAIKAIGDWTMAHPDAYNAICNAALAVAILIVAAGSLALFALFVIDKYETHRDKALAWLIRHHFFKYAEDEEDV